MRQKGTSNEDYQTISKSRSIGTINRCRELVVMGLRGTRKIIPQPALFAASSQTLPAVLAISESVLELMNV